ncbi:AIPR family protein [Pseudomonas aestiva]|uniref:AIPR family protein n=1 Tax=Pseudomonas aestiva TaxID=3136739 RepID=UPI0032677921
MAKNDKLLVDGIIDDRLAQQLPSSRRDEAFEYLAFEQILKEYDLSHDLLTSGSVDGRQDGGIDGFYIFVNGHLLIDPESFSWPRTGSELNLVLITCKHHDTFKQATLDALIATLTELLDFAIDDADLTGAYSKQLLQARERLKYAYRRLSPRLSNFSVNVFYASRGDTTEIGEEVISRGMQIAQLIKDSFGSSKPEFKFLGSTELVELYRKHPNYTLELPFIDVLSKGEQYVLLARLSDYFGFISDKGSLRRYLFDSNVRDFMGLNRVNEDIKETLENENSPDFWWLNNGVTILASSANITGKSIQADDIQIVNGLQTTESIFRHISTSSLKDDDRCVLVKVIVTTDASVRDSIIRATNNQTDVELASLHATDKIQRDIEDIMSRHGLYYERRKNFYANQDKMPGDLVTPLYAAAGFFALVLKEPHKAPKLRSKFMRSQILYDRVFNSSVILDAWPAIAKILKRTDAELEKLRPHVKRNDQFLKKWRYIIALIAVSDHYKKFDYTNAELSKYNSELITFETVNCIWTILTDLMKKQYATINWTGTSQIILALEYFADHWQIAGFKSIKATLSSGKGSGKDRELVQGDPVVVTDEFVEQVRIALPKQPWKPGMHRGILTDLNCTRTKLNAAIQKLIDQGILLRQEDGVLYDADGNICSFDRDRVDSETLQLKSKRRPRP